jgi:hypothetical protein
LHVTGLISQQSQIICIQHVTCVTRAHPRFL